MVFAKWVFRIAGIWGLLVLPPLYFMEANIALKSPPAITHPEYYYGFIGVALAWQIAFFIIASDPIKYRLLMIPSMLEKFLFPAAVIPLYLSSRAPVDILAASLIDFTLGVLFLFSLIKTRNASGH